MFRAPSQAGLPGIDLLLADVPANHDQVARHLGIKPSTLATYKRTGQAPRLVLLALFWESRWGRSAADTEAANAARLQASLAASLQREIDRLHLVIDRLERELASWGQASGQAANGPVYRTR